MIALSAKYGILAVHFYWIGAIPALAFLLLVLLPRYHALQLTSIPEYLGRRFQPSSQALSAMSFIMLMVVIAGIALSLTSRILHLDFNLGYAATVWLIAGLVSVFLGLGGVRAVIYAESLQIIIFSLVLTPLAVLSLRHTRGIFAHLAQLPVWQRHTLSDLSVFAPHDRLDLMGTLVGLGICLAFSYWCGDFILVQRLCATRDSEMLYTPRFAIVAKLAMPLLLVLPGLGLLSNAAGLSSGSYDLALPALLRMQYKPFFAVFAISTLCASCFMGVCSNLIVAAGIYAKSIAPVTDRFVPLSDRRLLAALCIAAATAGTFALQSRGLMESIQITFSMFNLPVACVLFAGIFLPATAPGAGTPAMLIGTCVGLLHWSLGARLHYGSPLSQSFYGAISVSLATFLSLAVISFGAKYQAKSTSPETISARWDAGTVIISAAALMTMVLLYAIFF